MKISLLWGENLVVAIPETGDEFHIRYGLDRDKKGALTVRSKLEDEDGRGGFIFQNEIEEGEGEEGAKEEEAGSDRVVKTLVCNSCGNQFDLTEGEQLFMQRVFGDKYKDPVRCRTCRKTRIVKRHRKGE